MNEVPVLGLEFSYRLLFAFRSRSKVCGCAWKRQDGNSAHDKLTVRKRFGGNYSSVVSVYFVDREYNPDIHCGVISKEDNKPCTRSLTCKVRVALPYVCQCSVPLLCKFISACAHTEPDVKVTFTSCRVTHCRCAGQWLGASSRLMSCCWSTAPPKRPSC